MKWLAEILEYLRRGMHKFREEETVSSRTAEEAFQASIHSSEEVSRGSQRIRTNTEFIREVLRGHE